MINWILGGLLLLAAVLAIRYTWKQHKEGKCAGGCAGCSGCCHEASQPEACSKTEEMPK